jgi:hypothetical protein
LIVAGAGSLLLWGDGEMDIYIYGNRGTALQYNNIHIRAAAVQKYTLPGIQKYIFINYT